LDHGGTRWDQDDPHNLPLFDSPNTLANKDCLGAGKLTPRLIGHPATTILTAIRSLFSYAALGHPEHALLIQRVLAIPPKRFDKRIVTFLTATEVDAMLAAPDQARWETGVTGP
jgi:hypothetical protein